MIVLFVLLGSMLLFRVLGSFGVPALATWQDSTLYALAVMFCFTGIGHFGRLRGDMEKMVPPWVPNPRTVVLLTGVLQILGALGLLIPETRFVTGVCLIAFLVAVFPANVHAARSDITLGGRAVTSLWIRTPMQVLFILLIAWTCLR